MVIENLQQRFNGWNAECFGAFSESQFEYYYPDEFQNKAIQALAITDKQNKRTAKKELLAEVMAWLDADEERAKLALSTSAAAVIDDLKRIALSMKVGRAI